MCVFAFLLIKLSLAQCILFIGSRKIINKAVFELFYVKFTGARKHFYQLKKDFTKNKPPKHCDSIVKHFKNSQAFPFSSFKEVHKWTKTHYCPGYSTGSKAYISPWGFVHSSSIQNCDFECTAQRVVKLPKYFTATDRQLCLVWWTFSFKSECLILCHLEQRHQ